MKCFFEANGRALNFPSFLVCCLCKHVERFSSVVAERKEISQEAQKMNDYGTFLCLGWEGGLETPTTTQQG